LYGAIDDLRVITCARTEKHFIQTMTNPSFASEQIRFAFLEEPPFCYRTADGAVTGADVELARHVLQEVGVGSITFIETEFAELIPGLSDGQWDMTTGLFITPERQRLVDFSQPIWALPDGLIVPSANPLKIDGYVSIARACARLGVVKDQVQHRTALDLGISERKIEIFRTYGEATEAVLSNEIDAFASVAMAHRGYLMLNSVPLMVVEVPEPEKVADKGAFAFAKSQSRLRSEFDRALASFMKTSGYKELMAQFA
jgi:polar amino acid transport system substrate-binding protein